MTRLWTFHSIPELRRLSESRRREVLYAAVTGAGTASKVLMVGGGVALFLVALTGLVILLNVLRMRVSPAALAAAGTVFALLVCAAIHQLAVRLVQASVRAYLKSQRRDGRLWTCLRCGYDQRGTVGAFCPECGATVASPWAPPRQSDAQRRRAA